METATNHASESEWREFSDRLRRYVSRRVPARHVDDATGEILLRLVKHRDKLAAADQPLAWMYRVARNALIDFQRKSESENAALAGAVADADVAAPEGSDDAGAPAAALSECVRPFVRALPRRYAEALTLTDLEGLSQREAAHRLGLSLSGVKSRVQRGREKLKHAIVTCCAVEANARGEILDFNPRKRAGQSGGSAACDRC